MHVPSERAEKRIIESMCMGGQGNGQPGALGGPVGDILVEVRYRPDPRFERRGSELWVDVAVPFKIAALGGKITVPTLGSMAE